MKVAIVVHAYYQEQLYEIIDKIRVVVDDKQDIDVYFTLPQERLDLYHIISNSKIATAIYSYPNQGMDLLPFFELIPSLQCYDWILKLHTKNCHDELNRLWFTTLLQALIGSKQVFRNNLTLLDKHPDWVMMGSLPFFLSAKRLMFDNQHNVDKLIDLWGLCKRADWGFFAGSLYWIRPNVLLAASQQLLVHRQWFSEVFAKDGQMAHALERAITLLVQHHGDIGLIYGDQFYINHKHPVAINQALSKQLLTAICDIDEVVAILQQTNWLDINKYKALSQLDFVNDRLAYEHYALVGQFSAFAELVLPIALKRKQEKLLSWNKLEQRVRKKGLISIIIPVLNEIKLTISCLQSIVKFKQDNIEVIVVDNGSSIINHKILKTYCKLYAYIKLVRLPHNLNFSVGCNYGFSQSSGEYIVFLNNDTSVTKNWLSPLITCIKQQDIAMAQPLLLYPNNTVQCAGVVFGNDGFGVCRGEGKSCDDGNISYSTACPALTGACMMLRADDFIRLSGFDAWFVNGQEDIDLCLRIQKLYPNKKLWYCADSVVYHRTSKTVGRSTNITRNRRVFGIKYRDFCMSDMFILKKANEYFQGGAYEKALDCYLNVIKHLPEFKDSIKFNIYLALNKIGANVDLATIDECIDALLEGNKAVGVQKKSISSRSMSYEEAFDAQFYLNTYPDVKEAGVDPFEHYSSWGWREGRLPNDWFDPNYYKDTYSDIDWLNQDPLEYYIRAGQHLGHEFATSNLERMENTHKDIPRIIFDDVSDVYVDYRENEKLDSAVKLIAFYLPQFHPFPENDEWWGKGFTEWTNVTKAKPNFIGHYQPHLPIHNGFYDLRVPEVMIEQAKLAKNYGVYGFNFYYYWFDGKVLMHKPFEILLKHKEIDINFCITWANENWTRRWDGEENDVLIGQNHCEEDSVKFIEHMYQYFNDDRYIRVNNKPVLIIYRSNIIPNMAETIDLWRRKVKEAGFDGLYLIGAQTFGFKNPKEYGFDAVVEFPPHNTKAPCINNQMDLINGDYAGYIFDYHEVVENKIAEVEPPYKRFRTAMLSWDNTARKQNSSHIFANFSMLNYKQWLAHIATNVYNNDKYSKEEKFIFVNAWNEWAEGTHLEPDRNMGYNYLQTTYDVLKEFNEENCKLLSNHQYVFKKYDYAVVLHMHYTETWGDIMPYLNNLTKYGFDLYITITNTQEGIVERIRQSYPLAYVQIVENRGRDIRPFIEIYSKIKDLGYTAVCKIHSKKSKYRDDGDEIRNELLDGLLSDYHVDNICTMFKSNSKLGLITLDKYMIDHTIKSMFFDKVIVDSLVEVLGVSFQYSQFPAGSMYWFNPKALIGIEKIKDNFFPLEKGLADGTIAHAIERIIISIVNSNGYQVSLL